jgi:hypothetical protein
MAQFCLSVFLCFFPPLPEGGGMSKHERELLLVRPISSLREFQVLLMGFLLYDVSSSHVTFMSIQHTHSCTYRYLISILHTLSLTSSPPPSSPHTQTGSLSIIITSSGRSIIARRHLYINQHPAPLS